MYIAHYKAVGSANEFYAKERKTLDYPTQVQVGKERFLLNNTYIVPGVTQRKNFKERLNSLGIKTDVDVDTNSK